MLFTVAKYFYCSTVLHFFTFIPAYKEALGPIPEQDIFLPNVNQFKITILNIKTINIVISSGNHAPEKIELSLSIINDKLLLNGVVYKPDESICPKLVPTLLIIIVSRKKIIQFNIIELITSFMLKYILSAPINMATNPPHMIEIISTSN